MSSRAGLAGLLALAGLALDLAAVSVLAAEMAHGIQPPIDGNTAGGYALGATFPIVGWIIASRRPRNAIGWIFLVIGLSQSLATFADVYAAYGLAVGTAAPPLAAELAWVGVWSWAPGFVLLLTLSVLLFPDGRLPSRRWRPVVWAVGVSLALVIVPMAIAVWPIRTPELATGRPPADDGALALAAGLQGVGLLLAAAAAIASVAALIVRFRGSTGPERRQLKWFTFAGSVEVVLIAATPFIDFGNATAPISALSAVVVGPLLPIAATVAILRYRLYDIDRIVSRTIAWSALTALLAAVFVALVLLLQALLVDATSSQPIAVAASTLVVASLFQPLRRGIQVHVDRRFNRTSYDAERTLGRFTARLRDDVDLANVASGIREVVTDTLAPMRVSVWIRPATTEPGASGVRVAQPRNELRTMEA
jgi:hypothetical protein